MGVRCDLVGPGDFNSMVNFIRALSDVHKQAGVSDIVSYVSSLGVPHVVNRDIGKDLCCFALAVLWSGFW